MNIALERIYQTSHFATTLATASQVEHVMVTACRASNGLCNVAEVCDGFPEGYSVDSFERPSARPSSAPSALPNASPSTISSASMNKAKQLGDKTSSETFHCRAPKKRSGPETMLTAGRFRDNKAKRSKEGAQCESFV
jgi:hypothetical protein